jgi:ADP-dependent NAD(P)H-hydrate dehydratase / NAD(P)H-hydrate epimerase
MTHASASDELGFPIALLTSAELPAIDRHMAETGTSGYVLMERAGTAVAREASVFAPEARQIVVVSGPNNNGGDCMCAARIMRDAGRDVTVALFAEPSQLPPDPAKAAERWTGPLVRATPAAVVGADLIIDGLYGGGVKHDITGEAARIVAAINDSSAKTLSVDFPTGISGVTGAVLGTAVKADRTITFFCLKPGQLLVPGRIHCGPVVVDSLGIPASVMNTVNPKTFHNRPGLWRSALPRERTVRTRVRASFDGPIAAGVEAVSPGATTDRNDADVIVVRGGPQCVAAGALAVVSVDTSPASDGASSWAIRAPDRPVVLVFEGDRYAEMFADFPGVSALERVREAAASCNAVVVYLGRDRIVAASDRRAALSGNAAPESAGAEECDVVSGVIGGLLAQGMPAFEAAAAATWLLGEAKGKGAGTYGAAPIPLAMSLALKDLR